jgi:hypothetical protein
MSKALNMILMTIKSMLNFQKLIWKKFNLHCKRPLLKQKNLVMGDMNGKSLGLL